MEQHPLPRQITSFEFKLIGFMTLRQFLYLILFFPIGYIVFALIPVPVIRQLAGAIVVIIGLLLAFLPVNDRPLDYFIRTLIKRLTSPTQYTFHKINKPVYFLENLYYYTDPHKVFSHIETQEKLAAYMAKTRPASAADKRQTDRKRAINQALRDVHSPAAANTAVPAQSAPPQTSPQQTVAAHHATPIQQSPPPVVSSQTQATQAAKSPTPFNPPAAQPAQIDSKHPFFIGVVRNHKQDPIGDILIYVQDASATTVRILKTNNHGVFATYKPLNTGTYSFIMKDPKGTYFFDTMKVPIDSGQNKPLEILSKELI
jgi:hypothetical protein